MLIDNAISILDFAVAISEAVDLVAPALNDHHKRVAYISYNIALDMGLPENEVEDIVLAALLHDIGAFSVEDRIELLSLGSYDIACNEHAVHGYRLLRGFRPLFNAAALIKCHHTEFNGTDCGVQIGSYIIHLGDRVAAWVDDSRNVNEQIHEIMERIKQNKNMFHPDALAALIRLYKHDYFLIEAFSPSLKISSLQKARFSNVIADLDTLRDFAQVLAYIIDFRSRFTATHSSGVAAVAKEIATILGFSARECNMVEIAGFLHDLGKLAVPNNILEKNGPLTAEEYSVIKTHPYYTYTILRKVRGMEDIAAWAALHHEKLHGRGYPFHVSDENFPKLARIIALADVLTALTEDRPYRPGLCEEKVMYLLRDMADSAGGDSSMVDMIQDNYRHINNVRITIQQKALKEYEAFSEGINANEFGLCELKEEFALFTA